MKKADYWDPTFEDMLTLIARLPRIAALIYRHVFRNGEITKLVRARPRPRPS
jgi:citrate synthase